MNFLNAFASVPASRTGKTVNLHVPLFADKSLIPATETAEHEEVALLTEITKLRSIFLASSLHDDAIFSFSENESVITRLFIENIFARATSSSRDYFIIKRP